MADFRNFRPTSATQADASIDMGLRSYMLGVYNAMAIGLVITGIAAFVIASLATSSDPTPYMLPNGVYLTSFGVTFYTSPFAYVVMFAPLIAVFFLSFKIGSLSTSSARMLFFVYAALVGLSLSSIILRYTPASITQTFFISAAAFGSLSLYGYTTKRDLTGMGSFLFMGLIGLLLAMVVNLFLGSNALQFAISIIGVLIFAGLTAYDTQTIKVMYYEGDEAETRGRKVVMGALTLYLDFINMFVFLLQFLGQNRNS
ncbi:MULTISPECIES: Bax inhibitor-1/YccA family protein [Bartonella]|uniref:Bax inhibitor-1/YccA family protein n=1 Tax=Bartonella TaxID=773 RepID=UPI0018DE0AF2|nr:MULTISPECIES: Bax inhibitor-1/YccA family protein [Bartonella]MBH9974633.1 Bax inhibitor-1/YccA family protein [Bartonella choladocola]MBI0014240.1 Bax inhibitor-1/YccA family protein [Bartonella sp. B10834G3]